MRKCSLVVIVFLAACPSQKEAEEQLQRDVEQETKKVEKELGQKTIDEAIAQYQIVARAGLKQEMCLRAGVVVEAHLMAKQEEDWRVWKQIQYRDCKKAGITLEKP